MATTSQELREAVAIEDTRALKPSQADSLKPTRFGATPNDRLGLERYRLALTGIVLVQALLLGYACSRGTFYGDDLSYMASATGRSLGWNYLAGPLNDHFVPGLRLVFWVLNRTTGLNYGVTIVARVILQAGTTVLLAELLRELAGRTRGVLLVLGWYAFTPLLMPGTVWLTTAVHLSSAQFFLVLTLLLHLRYARGGRLRDGFGSAVALLLAVCFWELSALTLLMLPVLSYVFLFVGSPRQRLVQTLRQWPEWVAHFVLLSAWAAQFVDGPYGGSAHRFSADNAWSVLRVGWADGFASAISGGPWRWFYFGDVYFSVADPPIALAMVAELVILGLLVLGVRRNGWRAVAAFAMPTLIYALGTLIVGVGRFWAFGDLTPRSFNYSFPLALPAAVGFVLALSRPRKAGQPTPDRIRRSHALVGTRRHRLRVGALIVVAAVFVASCLYSDQSFLHRWSENPSESYLDSLRSSVEQAGPNVNLWDTAVPSSVMSPLAGGNHVSDVLHLAGLHARFQEPDSDPLLVSPTGKLVPAQLYPSAQGVKAKGAICEALVQGVGTWHIRLNKPTPKGEGFLSFSYFQQRPSTLVVQVLSQAGSLVDPVPGSRTSFPKTVSRQLLRLPATDAQAVVITSASEATNICIGDLVLGAPFAITK